MERRFFGIAKPFSVALGLILTSISSVTAGPFDLGGVWLTQAGDAKVAVSRCGSSLCGRIVWLKTPIDPATGKPQVDDKNPNPSLAKRRVIGLGILIGMTSRDSTTWSGRIYNADDGKTYSASISLPAENALKVTGCAGSLCGSETWSRVGKR